MSKLTERQMKVLRKLSAGRSVLFESIENQEAACQLDGLGLCVAYTDSGNSLGVIWACITDAGRRALAEQGVGHG